MTPLHQQKNAEIPHVWLFVSVTAPDKLERDLSIWDSSDDNLPFTIRNGWKTFESRVIFPVRRSRQEDRLGVFAAV